jgi:hypothetical protein
MINQISNEMIVRLLRPSLALAAVLIGLGSPARADLTTYFGIDQGSGSPPTTPDVSLAARNSFIMALNGVGVENFESQSTGSFPTTLDFMGTSVTASASTTDSSNNYVTTGTSNGTFATSGTHYLYNTGNGAVNDTLTFSAPVAGFGMYVTDLSDGVSSADQIEYKLTFSDNTTQTVETSVGANNNNANVLFFGVISNDPSETITSVEILNSQPTVGDSIGIDDVTVGAAVVPEPTSLVLTGVGLLGLAIGFRRRGRKPSRAA